MALEPLRATLFDGTSGAYLRRVPVKAAPWSKDVGGWGTFQVTVARTPSANLPLLRSLAQPWRTLCVLTRGRRVLQGGPVIARPFKDSLVLKGEGFGAMYRKRLVLNRLLRGMTVDGEILIDEDNPAPEWVLTLDGSYVDIATLLIEETQDWGPLPVTVPELEGGSRTRTYYGYDFATVEDRLRDIMRLEDGPELRFTGELVPGGVQFNFEGADELVSRHHHWNTALPADACTVDGMDDDGSDMANELWMLGGKNDDILLATRGDDGFTRLSIRNLFEDPRYMRPQDWTFHNLSSSVDLVVPGRVEDVPHQGMHLHTPVAQDSFAYLAGESTTSFQFGMHPGVWEFSAEGSVRRFVEGEMPPEISAKGDLRSRARAIVVHVWDTALNDGAGGFVIWHSPQVPNVEDARVRVAIRVGIPETATGAFVRYYLGATKGEITWSQFQLAEITSYNPDTRWSDYLWGGKPPTADYTYAWEGAPDASPSVRTIRPDAPPMLEGYPLLQVADTSHSTVSDIQTLRQHLRGALRRWARTQEVIDVWVSASEIVEPGDWADVRTVHPLYGPVLLPLKVVGVSGDTGSRIKLSCRIREGEEADLDG